MDLIVLNYDGENRLFIKILPITGKYIFSCSTGMSAYSSNDFELKMPYKLGENLLEIGQFLMYGDSEFGGVITQRAIDTRSHEVTYRGYTLRGFLANQAVTDSDSETKDVVGHVSKLLFFPFGIYSNNIINNSSTEQFLFSPTIFSKVMDALDSVASQIDSVYTFNIKNGKINVLISPKTTHNFDASQVDMILDENYSQATQIVAYNPKTLVYAFGGPLSPTPRFLRVQKIVESNLETVDELTAFAEQELLKERAIIATDIFSDIKNAEVGDDVVASILEIGVKLTKKVVEKSLKITNGNEEITYTLEG